MTFDHRWEQSKYSYFRDRIHAHAAEIEEAYDEPDKDRSIAAAGPRHQFIPAQPPENS